MRKKLCVGDIIAALTIVIVAVLLFILQRISAVPAEYVVIRSQEAEDQRYNISDDRELTVNSNGYVLHIIIENSTVRVADADCNDHICVSTGSINTQGGSIICAPAHVIITVEGGGDDADHIAG